MLSKYSILDEVSFDLIKKEPSVVYYITCLLESLKYLLKIHIHYLGKNFEGKKKRKKMSFGKIRLLNDLILLFLIKICEEDFMNITWSF